MTQVAIGRGDVICIRDYPQTGMTILSRVGGLEGDAIEGAPPVPRDAIWIVGDNEETGAYDSRTFGAVPRSFLVGKVTRKWLRASNEPLVRVH